MEYDYESQKNQESREGFFPFVWEIIKIAILALVIILPVRYFIAQPFFVKGASMEPSFQNGNYLIIDEISYRFGLPQRGEVAVFRFPEDPKQFFIKRIIGLPNETVEIKNNEVRILNKEESLGFVLDESEYLSPEEVTEGSLKIKLKKDEYFVLGDNRLFSSDSRRWGVLGRHFIIGKVFVRAWPLSEIKYFPQVSYPLTAD